MDTVIQAPIENNHSVFLQGPAGAGKSQLLIERLRHLLEAGISGYSILVLLPDRMNIRQYKDRLASLDLGPFSAVEFHTYYSLATQLVQQFWPLVAGDAGFARPQRPPTYLTYETAQYTMSQIIEPKLDAGYFEGLSMRRQRIVSQLIDNLNKAAVNGYEIDEVQERLSGAWTGEPDRLRYYDQAQTCIHEYREHCLQEGLLDISLAIDVFHNQLVEKPMFWRYFTERYEHLLVDNLEETVPVAQDLISRLLPETQSALLVYDQGGGFRIFLGVDPEGALELREECSEVVTLEESATSNPHMAAFAARLGQRLGQVIEVPAQGTAVDAVAEIIHTRYRADMIARVVDEIKRLRASGVAPGDIAIVAPYVDGVLRFSLQERMRDAGIPFRVIRRYESLREEPVVRACLTLAALAHPGWDIHPAPFDVAETLSQTVEHLDPVRAALITRELYDESEPALVPRDGLSMTTHDRIGFALLERYDEMREWLEEYKEGEPEPLDHFLSRLFGELLSRPDFDPEDAAVYEKLIASAKRFRSAAPGMGIDNYRVAIGRHYAEMVNSGIVAAQYHSGVPLDPKATALTAPIYTYLLSGHSSRYQFWLDIGSIAWWEPPHQPLTNPHVLSRQWPVGEQWTDAVDYQTRNRTLYRLVTGLTQRCRDGIYLCASELELTGEAQDSPLLRAVDRVLRQ